MLVVRTPLRLSLFGGGSDYPSYYLKHGGACLNATINKYCWLMARTPPDFEKTGFGHKFRIVYSKMEECNDLRQIEHPAVRTVLQRLGLGRAEIYHSSDLPARSGVGSSSAFVVGLLKALTTIQKKDWTADQIAEEAEYVERIELQETVGSQDQYACAHGGLNLIHFSLSEGIRVRPVFWDYSRNHWRSQPLEERLLLFYSGVQRTASDVAVGYVAKLTNYPKVMERLVEMAHQGRKLLQDVLYTENGVDLDKLDKIGVMLNEAWELKKSLSPAISTPQLDTIYTTARVAGALGGKVMGAGGGGHFLFYSRPEKRSHVTTALAGLGLQEIPFRFDWDGTTVVCRGE